MKISIKYYTVACMLLLLAMASCRKDPEIKNTAVVTMAGEWYVRINNYPKRWIMTTYNTSDDSKNAFWLQTTNLRDEDATPAANIGIKGKVAIQLNGQTFAGTDVTNVAATAAAIPKFSVNNGKIITNGTFGVSSRTPADSIYFEINVNGKVFKVSGFHRTGFQADEPK
jgi:hypothetical protein